MQTGFAPDPGEGLTPATRILTWTDCGNQLKLSLNMTKPQREAHSKTCAGFSQTGALLRQAEFAPVKFKRGIAMRQQIGNAVAAGIKVKFVGNLEGIKGLM